MKADTERIFGYSLLWLGLACIAFALYSAYTVFTNAANPPDLFQMKSLSFSLGPGKGNEPTEITVALNPELRRTANVFLYYLFMLFIIGAGSAISGMGIKLIKDT